ncbi:MAG: phosphate ABC transporter permease PstA [Acidimicrobiales bacterium]|jgi:phosphate transport system permease protein
MTVLTLDPSSDPILERRRRIQSIAKSSVSRRKAYSRIAISVCWLFLLVALVPLVAVIVYTFAKGIPAWSDTFFTQVTKPEGIPNGGAYNAIVGTIIIGAVATAVTVPFGLLAGLFLAESDGRIASGIRFTADIMTGVPSILMGIFGYIALVKTFGYSGLIGAFAIGMIMLPVVMRAGETAIRGVPSELNEAGLALGARKFTIVRRVILPAALPGVITGVLLAIARGVGETAPLLFTIFGNQYLQWNPTKAMEALPILIYNNSSQPYPDLVQIAWGAALLLMAAVLVLSIGSRVLAAILQRERR